MTGTEKGNGQPTKPVNVLIVVLDDPAIPGGPATVTDVVDSVSAAQAALAERRASITTRIWRGYPDAKPGDRVSLGAVTVIPAEKGGDNAIEAVVRRGGAR